MIIKIRKWLISFLAGTKVQAVINININIGDSVDTGIHVKNDDCFIFRNVHINGRSSSRYAVESRNTNS